MNVRYSLRTQEAGRRRLFEDDANDIAAIPVAVSRSTVFGPPSCWAGLKKNSWAVVCQPVKARAASRMSFSV